MERAVEPEATACDDERATPILEGTYALGANATAAEAPARKSEAQNFILLGGLGMLKNNMPIKNNAS